MTDQLVIPDREAMAREMVRHYPVYGGDTARCGCGWTGREGDRQAHLIDALLPLLIEALDRARQQGRGELRRELLAPCLDDADTDEPSELQARIEEDFRMARAESYEAGRQQGKHEGREESTADVLIRTLNLRLARGGPNRKDEE